MAELAYKAPGACRIRNLGRLVGLLQLRPLELRDHPVAFEDDADLIAPWQVTQMIVRRAAELNPEPVLRHLDMDEAEQRRMKAHGASQPASRGLPARHLDAEFFAEGDDKPYGRPCRNLLRQWCGAEAVEQHDELTDLRQEVRRLDLIVQQAIEALHRAGATRDAKKIERVLGVTTDQAPMEARNRERYPPG